MGEGRGWSYKIKIDNYDNFFSSDFKEIDINEHHEEKIDHSF